MKVSLVYNPTLPGAKKWAERARGAFPGADIATRPTVADRLVLFGGDGTIRAAANARPDAELAVVPCGSGNDFAKTLGIPANPEEAIRVARGEAHPIDLVEYECGESGFFLNIAEIGLGARVVRHANRLKPVTGRRASYSLAILTALAGHRLRPIRVEIDGRHVGEYFMANTIVANGQYFGGGMHPVPHARPDDGLLEIAILNDFPRWKILTQGHVLRTGIPRNHQRIHHFRGKEVRITSPEPVGVEADGDLLGDLPVRFRVRPGALRFVRP